MLEREHCGCGAGFERISFVISVMQFFEGRVRKDGDRNAICCPRRPALALESRCTEMTAQCEEKAESMAAGQRRWLLVVFRCSCSLFLAVICRWCLSKTEGFCGRGRPPGCILRDLQRYERRPRAAAPDTSNASESLFERGPNEALGVHRIVDRRHHAKEGMDHTGELPVFDRHAGAL